MLKPFDYGPRLTGGQYDRKVIELHGALPPKPTREQDRTVRRAELDIAIDYRLGVNFPGERRDALWAINERVERKRLRLIFKYIFKRIFSKSFQRAPQGIAGYLVSEYAKVLSKAELQAFFGADAVQTPSLPVDFKN